MRNLAVHALGVLGIVAIFSWSANTARAQDRPLDHCEETTASAFLDVNNVRARVVNSGKLFWDDDRPVVHEFPRGGGQNTVQMISLWLAAKVGGEARTAMTYSNIDPFRAGPHDAIASGQPCNPYDRIFSVGGRDMHALDNGTEPAADVVDWPWQLGAPVVDGDGVPGNYNLAGGDRPLLLGDETHWWIMTDQGGGYLPHAGFQPIGLEVHGMAFASAAVGFENTTFYQFRVINKSSDVLDSLFIGLQQDFGIGPNARDNFIGVDTTLSLAFGYNADNDDVGGFGMNPPAVGVQYLNSKMAAHSTLVTDFSEQGLPFRAEMAWLRMQGRWRDGQPMTEGGRGLASSEKITRFLYPGDPVTRSFWSQLNADGEGGVDDSTHFASSLSATVADRLAPGEETTLFFAVINGQGSDHLNSISVLRDAARTLEGVRPEDVPTSGAPLLGPVPVASPHITGIADGARRQPRDLKLRWDWPSGGAPGLAPDSPDLEFELQLRHDRVQRWVTSRQEQPLDLEPGTTYQARVRAMTQAGYGPWSEEVTFSTGGTVLSETSVFADMAVVANAAGPLDPPDGAVADFLGFPGRPPTDRQQAGSARWIIHSRAYDPTDTFDEFLSSVVLPGRQDFRPALLPYDYEIRFTEEGSVIFDNFTRDIGRVPFELWRTGIGTPDDSSDDVRLVPGLYNTRPGFGIECRSNTANRRHITDGFSWFFPRDMTPGRSGYDAWEAELRAEGTAARQTLGSRLMSGMVLVNLDGTGDPCSPDQPLPEEGTIFRLTTARPPAAIPGAPADEAVLPAGSVSFHWSEGLIPARRLEVARDAGFTNLLLALDHAESGRAQMFASEPGTYWWRVIDLAGTPSEPIRFFVGTAVDTDDVLGSALPDRFALGAAYPNPFTQGITIPYDLPQASRVRLRLFDALGREVTTLVDAELPAGRHTARFTVGAGSGGASGRLSGGTYFYVLEAGGFRDTGQVVYLR